MLEDLRQVGRKIERGGRLGQVQVEGHNRLPPAREGWQSRGLAGRRRASKPPPRGLGRQQAASRTRGGQRGGLITEETCRKGAEVEEDVGSGGRGEAGVEGEADGTSREPRSKNKLEGETTGGSGDMD